MGLEWLLVKRVINSVSVFEVEITVTLPFAPFAGLVVYLSGATDAHQDTKTFVVQDIAYDMDDGVFLVFQTDATESPTAEAFDYEDAGWKVRPARREIDLSDVIGSPYFPKGPPRHT